MVQSLRCPNCGKNLSEASILALAPVCDACQSVLTIVGGTLGLTGAYGLADSEEIKRKRIKADLRVFDDYIDKYRGGVVHCENELKRTQESYARLPDRPVLHQLKDVPSFFGCVFSSIFCLGATFCYGFFAFLVITLILAVIESIFSVDLGRLVFVMMLIASIVCLSVIYSNMIPYFHAIKENGNMPTENERMIREFETKCREAVEIAKDAKLAADHKLRIDLRDYEAKLETVKKKRDDVSKLLA